MLTSLKKLLVGTLAFITTIFFLAFAIINRETVTLNLEPLPYSVDVRLFVLVGVLVLMGILLGWTVASFECRRRYLLRKETLKRMEAMENELAGLRTRSHHLPLAEHSAE